jgi:peptidyl-dipeptidase A
MVSRVKMAAAVLVLTVPAGGVMAQGAKAAPTAEEARRFADEADARLLELALEANRASWVQSTFITEDTEFLSAAATRRAIEAAAELAKQATRFDGLKLPADVQRRLALLKVRLTLAAPANDQEAAELTRIASAMEGAYGRGKWCRPGQDGAGGSGAQPQSGVSPRGSRPGIDSRGEPPKEECLDINGIEEILAQSRDPKALQDAWIGWHAIATPMRPQYQRFVELSNKGARELGFADTGAMWRSKYDMPPAAFAAEVDRLYEQLKPLYVSLHTYVRRKLREHYGPDVVPANGPIPAHLLGNIWAQDWSHVYPLVGPKEADPGFDLTAILKAKNTDAKEMARYGERFFTSLGFAPLPATFWERSLFVKPADHDVVCHASAWDIDEVEDLRIKMCIQPTDEDFTTIHHELGHNFYQRAYNKLPFLFRDSANDGFHEAIGDTIALSVTPAYLKTIGLIDQEPDASRDIGLLLRRALDKVAFVPFGLLIDQWRWKVFSGEVTPASYNASWWELKRKYQGVAPPVARTEAQFDPGAKYHVPANVPYTRYFLADVLQFQFHRALCRAAGQTGPLHRCSIYGSKEAGQRLQKMLEMGQSRPWPEAMEALTGERAMDATAILDYFAPLKKWLDEQNAGQPSGW